MILALGTIAYLTAGIVATAIFFETSDSFGTDGKRGLAVLFWPFTTAFLLIVGLIEMLGKTSWSLWYWAYKKYSKDQENK